MRTKSKGRNQGFLALIGITVLMMVAVMYSLSHSALESGNNSVHHHMAATFKGTQSDTNCLFDRIHVPAAAIASSSDESERVLAVFDGNPATNWTGPCASRTQKHTIWVELTLPSPVVVAEYRVLSSADLKRTFDPSSWVVFAAATAPRGGRVDNYVAIDSRRNQTFSKLEKKKFAIAPFRQKPYSVYRLEFDVDQKLVTSHLSISDIELWGCSNSVLSEEDVAAAVVTSSAPSGSSAGGSNSVRWERLKNPKLSGGEIRRVAPVEHNGNCQTLCQDQRDCNAAVFLHKQQTCVLYRYGLVTAAAPAPLAEMEGFLIAGSAAELGSNKNDASSRASTVGSSPKEECAIEGGVCKCVGLVSYGYGDQVSTKTSEGDIECVNSVFGDPVPGKGKKCWCHSKRQRWQDEAAYLLTTTQQKGQTEFLAAMTSAEKEVAVRMKYWRPLQEKVMMPNKWARGKEVKYVTFTPDAGAFNNKRVGFETTVLLAIATGRTLVMPPDHSFAFRDYWGIEDIQRVAHVLPFCVFATRMEEQGKALFAAVAGLETACHDNVATKTMFTEALKHLKPFYHKWNPVNGNDMLWFPRDTNTGCDNECKQRAQAHRASHTIVVYDEEHQQQQLLHFAGDNPRLLVAYPTLVAFDDPADMRLAYLTMRNHVHLNPYFFDMAAKVVADMGIANFHAMHIRRGDLQYDESKFKDSTVIYNRVKHLFKEGDTVYIATDETDRKYFAPMAKHYKLKFFSDYPDIEKLTRSYPDRTNRQTGDNYYQMFWSPDFSGMVEAIICSMASKFVGTYLSTFSAVIFQLRGYQEEVPDKNVYLTTHDYTDDPAENARRYNLLGDHGTGFHWQDNLHMSWKWNDWQYD